MQIKLSFMEKVPIPKTAVWDQLDDEDKAVVMESVARLIAKMIFLAGNNQELKNDR
jgi:hypothetical protein